MPITQNEVQLLTVTGSRIKSGSLNNLFTDCTVGDGNTYAFCVVHNADPSESLTSVKAWLGLDSGGGTFAIALAQSSAQKNNSWQEPLASSLTYSSPTSKSSGVALPDIPAGYYVLLCCRRNESSATSKYPESNTLYVGGTSPV